MEEIKCNQIGKLTGRKWDKLHDMSRRVYGIDGLSPTLHTAGGGNTEPIAYDEQNGYARKDGTVGTLTTDGNSPKHNNRIVEPNYRIRKLTERECFRLMGVKSEDFEKVRYGAALPKGSSEKIAKRTMTKDEWRVCWRIMRHDRQSVSSCYHLAGDSIVTACLMAIFGLLLEVDYKKKIAELTEELKEK